MTEIVGEQMSFADLDTPFGKMFREQDQAPEKDTQEKISRQSSRSSLESLPRTHLMCLCLKRASGPVADSSTMSWEDGAWPGTNTMLNGGECRKDAAGFVYVPIGGGLLPGTYCLRLNCGDAPREPMPTKLSDILEQDADPRYRLSAKACQGILNRAGRRGKDLPEILRTALEQQIERTHSNSTAEN